MNADTRVVVMDWQEHIVGGLLIPWGDADHLNHAGATFDQHKQIVRNVGQVRDSYCTPATDFYLEDRGEMAGGGPDAIPVWANHERAVGPVGELLWCFKTEQGLIVRAKLNDRAQYVTFGEVTAARSIPGLLQSGDMYWCAELFSDIDERGFVRRCGIAGLSLVLESGIGAVVHGTHD